MGDGRVVTRGQIADSPPLDEVFAHELPADGDGKLAGDYIKLDQVKHHQHVGPEVIVPEPPGWKCMRGRWARNGNACGVGHAGRMMRPFWTGLHPIPRKARSIKLIQATLDSTER